MIALLLALHCGSELWSQKVLTDKGAARALAPAPIAGTIEQLGSLPLTARRRAYTIVGRITVIKHEADEDFHVALSDDAGHTMIVEFAHPGCAVGSLALAAITRARKQAAALHVGDHVQAVGMLFFDRLHGQTGVAPNGAEIHPVFIVKKL